MSIRENILYFSRSFRSSTIWRISFTDAILKCIAIKHSTIDATPNTTAIQATAADMATETAIDVEPTKVAYETTIAPSTIPSMPNSHALLHKALYLCNFAIFLAPFHIK